ncbi:MAG: peptidoglycan DD-metalloendopeptidase family protein, partial [Clostridia bacterium]|nr:peptidoglycan DD-metalloendopeptidase family protein [Clostridia bacterium]
SIYDLQQNKDWIDNQLEEVITERIEHQENKEYYEKVAKNLEQSLIEQQLALFEFENTIDELQKTIEELTETIVETEREYKAKMDLLKQRIIDGYIDSKTNLLTLLTDSNSVSEFFEKLEIRKYIARFDQQLIDEISLLSINLVEKRALSDALKIKYEVAARVTEIAIETMTQIQDKAEKTALMSAEQIAALKQREDNLMDESDKLLEAIREMQQKMAYAGGEMIWPVPANRSALSGGDFFGMRMHPIFHEWRMHTGIDIGAPQGSNILAVNAGTVVMAGYSTGYGNKVVVDHGGGIMTLYAHASKILVSVGQGVEKGQVIALVGSTGWSTGPHLHFEVIKEGERVNPLEFVNQKSGTL